LAANRRPGHDPEVENVLPSQPQYWRKSRVHARDLGAQTPGCASSQPCPSQTPDAQSPSFKHDAPSAAAVPACTGVDGAVGSAGVAVSVGVAGSLGEGSGVDGGAVTVDGPVDDAGALHAIRNTAISNSRALMRASYTSLHGK
jgi:hypothetical protein